MDCLARVVQGRAGPQWTWGSHRQLCEQRTALFMPMGPSCWRFCEVWCPALFRGTSHASRDRKPGSGMCRKD